MVICIDKLEALIALGDGVHWFCPRSAAEDHALCFDEDVHGADFQETREEETTRRAQVDEVQRRTGDALEACEVLAFDGGDAIPFQEQLKRCLHTQLTRCEICVREYHRARMQLQTNLESGYPADDVAAFMQKFDGTSYERITAGLNSMTEALLDLPPDKRSITTAGSVGMYGLFESLNCVPFLLDEDLLRRFFDKPFRLAQSRKKIKLPAYSPGMVAFLFSPDEFRSAWATRSLANNHRPFSGNDFEHNVKPFLAIAMTRVNVVSLELDFLPVFWRATRLILTKLTKDLVVNHLRAMDVNIFTLSLEHFQIDAPHFTDLLACYQVLLKLSANDFWDAMGSASPQNIIETICKSPTLESLLTVTEETEPLHLKEKMAWAETFIQHIKPLNLVPPLRALLHQLLHRFQNPKYSRYARNVTWETGLVCLLKAIQILTSKVGGGPICTHLIESVSKDHIAVIVQELDSLENKMEMQLDETENLGLHIVQAVLALDVQSLARDRAVILKEQNLDHELGISSLNIWKLSMRHVKGGNSALASAVLSGMQGLLSLEKIPPSRSKKSPRQAESWNNALGRVLGHVNADLLERLEGFSTDHLIDLYQEPGTAQALMALLFNADSKVHQSTLSIFKVLSGEDSRRDTVMHLIQAFPSATLAAIVSILKTISSAQVYAPCPIMLKLCTDLYSCLCDTQDGVLHAGSNQTGVDPDVINEMWQATWAALQTIFEQTEVWSSYGYEKTEMPEFCRQTMDFADYAFDQYSVIANVLKVAASKRADDKVGQQLLQAPNRTFRSITKWLRLRDEYLMNKSVILTAKILGRLQQVEVKVPDDAAQYLEDIVLSGTKVYKVRTNLSMNHKAELQRALEHHLGRPLHEVTDLEAPVRKKQGSLQDWATSGGSSGSGQRKSSKVIDLDASDVEKYPKELPSSKSTANEELKKRIAAKKALDDQARARAAQKQQLQSNDFVLKRQQAKAEQEKARQAVLAKEGGGGSGLTGMGDLGKVHTAKGQNVMISSDEDSEEDDDTDLDHELFGIPKSKERRKMDRPVLVPEGASGLKAEQKKGPTRIERKNRSLKDMRARLAPDLAPLHRTILSWDFFHNGDYPPGANPHQFSQVSNAFSDPVSYQQTFEPLLILEAWQGMAKSREENSSKPYQIKVQNRSNVDSFLEVSSMVSHAENRDLQLQEGDIVLFSKSSKPADTASSPNCLARIYRVKRQKAHLEIVYQAMPGTPLATHLTPQATVYGLKVQSITPLEREFGALKALQYYDLCNQIVRARPSSRIAFSDKQVSAVQDIYNVNRAQSEAINAALENDGFSLIQGPPGSGKTKTIVAIVGGLLSQMLSNPSKGATRITMPNANSAQRSSSEAPSKKLLVCAPSNAAVDELVMRMKEGIKTRNGATHLIKLVRIGRSDAINAQVKDVTIDELVAKKLGSGNMDAKEREKGAALFKKHEQVSAELRDMYQKRDKGKLDAADLNALEAALSVKRREKNELNVRIDSFKDKEQSAGREAELNRKKAQQAVLDDAHVICATLSGSGHDMFRGLNIEFETVIIDEAAQCVEMSSLIPLKYGCIKCIMVGDPKQLPPTVFSKEAAKFQYEQSLFVRMQNNFANEVHLLDTQYRMHPEISVFPSRTFYDGLLKDGDGMAGLRAKPWHSSALLAPYRFYDVKGQHQSAPKGHSLINVAEIDVAMALYERLTKDFANYDFTGQIGIITPYKSQLRALKDRFSQRYGNGIFDTIEFNTTDAFQGRESEVIIFSCVRASPAGGIGFLQDIRRMNVGLTRAKSSLWVLGNSDSLVRGQYWKKLVDDARARDCYTSGNVRGMLERPSSAYPASTANTRSMLDVNFHVPQLDSRSDSRAVPPTAFRRPQDTAVTASGNTNDRNEPRADADRMDGITYRFEDRVRKEPSTASATSTETSSRPPRKASEDVEMEDAGAPSRATAPSVDSASSRAETPLSGDENRSVSANGSCQSRPALVTPAVAVMHKKRPAPSPFMPPKKPRPQ